MAQFDVLHIQTITIFGVESVVSELFGSLRATNVIGEASLLCTSFTWISLDMQQVPTKNERVDDVFDFRRKAEKRRPCIGGGTSLISMGSTKVQRLLSRSSVCILVGPCVLTYSTTA